MNTDSRAEFAGGSKGARQQRSGGSRLMRDMPIRRKLGLMAASMIIPMCGLLAFYVYTSYSSISVTALEQDGMLYYSPLKEIGTRVNDHGAALVGAVVRGAASDDTASKAVVGMDDWLAKMDDVDRRFATPVTAPKWKQIRADWAQIKDAHYKTAEESLVAHSKLNALIADLKTQIAKDWGLVLDPEMGSYYAIDVAVMQIPDIENLVGDSRAVFAAIHARGRATEADKLQFLELAAVAKSKIQAAKDELEAVRVSTANDPVAMKFVNEIAKGWETDLTGWLQDAEVAILGGNASTEALKSLIVRGDAAPAALAKAHEQVMAAADAILADRIQAERKVLYITMALTAIALAFALWLVFAISKRVSGAITRLGNIAGSIATGDYSNPINKEGGDEIGSLFASIGNMQDQLQVEEANRAASANAIARMRGGLDATSTNVMVADIDNNIVYMNQSVTTLFRDIEGDLRKDLPNFSAARLIGENIDVFHKNPSHQRNLLSGLRGKHTASMVVGGRSMYIVANPILNDKGERLGTVVEWTDRTQEVQAAKEISALVDAVNSGDLSVRIGLEGKAGFYATMATGLNDLVGNVATVVEEVHGLVAAANSGDLAVRMQFDGKPGLNRTLGEGVNELVDEVANVVEEVQKLVASANSGDLTERMPVDGRSGLFQKVGSGVNDLVDNMANVISQVKEAASEVHRGADEISQGNTNLSQRTEEQASSLEETASSMEEMTSTVKQNADNAGQANQLAVAARDQAEKGGAVVAKAVRAMTEINDSSKKIADIIGVIDEIAFQTNLLALNAAVEAARAGEQGRGFAVVATEVRNLAGRSATAAKEIKGLIQDSVRKVDEGSSLVTQSGATLEQIVSAVKKVTDIVAEIAAASQEQSAGIEQVNKAVMQLDELTQQNAALVEEASAASQSMADQARSLNETMAKYSVSEGTSAVASAGVRAISAGTAPRPAATRPAASRPYAVKNTNSAMKRAREQSAAPAPVSRQMEATGTNDAVWKEF